MSTTPPGESTGIPILVYSAPLYDRAAELCNNMLWRPLQISGYLSRAYSAAVSTFEFFESLLHLHYRT